MKSLTNLKHGIEEYLKCHFPEALKEIFFWRCKFDKLNCRSIHKSYRPSIKIYSDASATGIGAHMSYIGTTKIVRKNFDSEQRKKSSTWRELYAILYALNSFKHFLIDRKVLCHTDNYAATSIIKYGSSKTDLQIFSESIFNLCKQNGIEIFAL